MRLKSRLITLNDEIDCLNQTITTIDKIIDTIDQEVECLDDTISNINSEIDNYMESMQSIESINSIYNTHNPSFKNQQTQTDHSRFESMYEDLKHDAVPVVENILWATIKRLICACIL
jgi:prefoldin subunit 5